MRCELYVSGLHTPSSLPVLRGTQKEQRWQHVNYNDLTCHVAVYLRGPQGTTPIWINGIESRGAANQLVGLTRWLVDGWKKQSGDGNQSFLREWASFSFLPPDSSDCTTSLFMNFISCGFLDNILFCLFTTACLLSTSAINYSCHICSVVFLHSTCRFTCVQS